MDVSRSESARQLVQKLIEGGVEAKIKDVLHNQLPSEVLAFARSSPASFEFPATRAAFHDELKALLDKHWPAPAESSEAAQRPGSMPAGGSNALIVHPQSTALASSSSASTGSSLGSSSLSGPSGGFVSAAQLPESKRALEAQQVRQAAGAALSQSQPQPQQQRSDQPGQILTGIYQDKLAQLSGMGFGDRQQCVDALHRAGGNVERAVEFILGMAAGGPPPPYASRTASAPEVKTVESKSLYDSLDSLVQRSSAGSSSAGAASSAAPAAAAAASSSSPAASSSSSGIQLPLQQPPQQQPGEQQQQQQLGSELGEPMVVPGMQDVTTYSPRAGLARLDLALAPAAAAASSGAGSPSGAASAAPAVAAAGVAASSSAAVGSQAASAPSSSASVGVSSSGKADIIEQRAAEVLARLAQQGVSKQGEGKGESKGDSKRVEHKHGSDCKWRQTCADSSSSSLAAMDVDPEMPPLLSTEKIEQNETANRLHQLKELGCANEALNMVLLARFHDVEGAVEWIMSNRADYDAGRLPQPQPLQQQQYQQRYHYSDVRARAGGAGGEYKYGHARCCDVRHSSLGGVGDLLGSPSQQYGSGVGLGLTSSSGSGSAGSAGSGKGSGGGSTEIPVRHSPRSQQRYLESDAQRDQPGASGSGVSSTPMHQRPRSGSGEGQSQSQGPGQGGSDVAAAAGGSTAGKTHAHAHDRRPAPLNMQSIDTVRRPREQACALTAHEGDSSSLQGGEGKHYRSADPHGHAGAAAGCSASSAHAQPHHGHDRHGSHGSHGRLCGYSVHRALGFDARDDRSAGRSQSAAMPVRSITGREQGATSPLIDVELQMLEGMGFKDAKRNREALMKADGQLEQAIMLLTSTGAQEFGDENHPPDALPLATTTRKQPSAPTVAAAASAASSTGASAAAAPPASSSGSTPKNADSAAAVPDAAPAAQPPQQQQQQGEGQQSQQQPGTADAGTREKEKDKGKQSGSSKPGEESGKQTQEDDLKDNKPMVA